MPRWEKKKLPVKTQPTNVAELEAKIAKLELMVGNQNSSIPIRYYPDSDKVLAELGLTGDQIPKLNKTYERKNVFLYDSTGQKSKIRLKYKVVHIKKPPKFAKSDVPRHEMYMQIAFVRNGLGTIPPGGFPPMEPSTMGIQQWKNLIDEGLRCVSDVEAKVTD